MYVAIIPLKKDVILHSNVFVFPLTKHPYLRNFVPSSVEIDRSWSWSQVNMQTEYYTYYSRIPLDPLR